MKKEYNVPEIEIISFDTEDIMEKGGIDLSAANPNDESFKWDW